MAARTNIYNNVNIRGTLSMRNYQFPSNDGNAGQILQTDGVGALSWVNVSGGTGSTSPGGSDTFIQYNDSGSFAGVSALTWDNSTGRFKTTNEEYGTATIETGEVPIVTGLFALSGAAMTFDSTASTANYVVGVGEASLSPSAILGEFDGISANAFVQVGGNRYQAAVNSGSTNATHTMANNNMALTVSNGSSGNTSLGLVYSSATIQLNGFSPIKEFIITNGIVKPFVVDSTSTITINEAYTIPKSDGSTGQVLTTDGAGSATWQSVSGSSGGTIVVEGGGTLSTMRDGVCNTASGDYSTVFGCQNQAIQGFAAVGGGFTNTASGYMANIAGGCGNTASGYQGTIAGGRSNCAADGQTFVGGGFSNCADGNQAAVVGGCSNIANGPRAFVGGGDNNTSSAYCTVVVGGNNNVASANTATVVGGLNNVASGTSAFVGGGCDNVAGQNSTISGGYNNKARAQFSFIGGGTNNETNGTVGGVSTVSGGYLNRALVDYSFIGGGRRNTNSSYCGVIGGGSCNTVTGNCSTIVGGANNCVYGTLSGILGGQSNAITGGSTTFIVGDNITADRTCTTFVNNLSIMNIPTGDPNIAGAVWSDGGTLKISSGGGP